MAAATAGYEWSRSSPLQHSPDTTSPMYPDRPIRPLPKRRLRARLSPEQADSIVYPPAPPSSAPLFSFPYSQLDKASGVAANRVQRGDHEHTCNCGGDHSELESDEEEDDRAAALQSSPSIQQYSRGLLSAKSGASAAFSKPSSASSSADGYESFENTNNKKKRKIPNMGSTGTHHNNLTAEMASMGISHPRDAATHDDGEGVGHYYGSGSSATQTNSSGTGISGAGRGRYARSGRTPERRVLGTSTNALNAGKAISGAKRDYNGAGAQSKGNPPEQGGIISTAIANAQAEQNHGGNENVSLLQQQAAKTSADKAQFTFTCGSDSANKMVWPGQQNGNFAPPESVQARGYTNTSDQTAIRGSGVTQGTQTSPNMNGAQQAGSSAKTQPQAQQGAQQPRKPRRKPGKIYALAARQRKMQQEYNNYHHPPSREDIWICEFCEYESIFGSPPEALVRQYEIKDRKERKRLAEKRRLLEKARMKGRKGKKGTKNAAKNNANANQQAQNPPANQRYDQPNDNAPLDQQDEEYFDDEYDDIPALAPPDTGNVPNGYTENHPPPPTLKATNSAQARGGGKATNGA